MIRKLKRCEIPEYLELVSHLSKIEYNMENLYRVFDNMRDKLILIYEEDGKIIATGSIQFEYKLSHGGYPVGHIEDVVVHPNYRKKSLGRIMVQRLIEEAVFNHCYKVVLSCRLENINFYKRLGFYDNEYSMRLDII